MSAKLFNESKYTKWYYNIIRQAQLRTLDGYKERHHIIPRSLGGLDESANLVDLTAKEHYIVHLLLPYMIVDSDHRKKMWGALRCMSKLIYKTHRRYVGSARFYEKAKENTDFGIGNRGRIQPLEERQKRAAALKGKVCSEDTKRKIGMANSKPSRRTPWNKGVSGYKIHSEETKQRISQERTGIPKSEETKAIMKAAQALRPKDSYAYDWKHDDSTIEKFKEMARNRPRLTCPHCGLEGSVPGMKRYHFDNCKALSAASNASRAI
jgi:hypothetical protein